MAYKFQLGASTMSGSLVQEGSLTIKDDDGTQRYNVDRDNGAVSGSGAIYHAGAATFSSTVAATGSVTAGTSFIIGSADLNETDMEKLDGITNGTAAANKALVADGNIDITGLRNVTGTGAITAGTSFIIGSADLNEADMEKLDGIVDGTVAANKAVVVDGNKDANGFRNIDGTGDLTMGTITMSGFTVDADGDTNLKTLAVDDGSTIGCDSDADLLGLNSNLFTVNGTQLMKGALSGSSTLYAAGAASFSSTIAASGSITSAGASISGTSALAVVTATSFSGSGTVHAGGAATMGSSLEVSGTVKLAGVADTAIAVGSDSLYFKDADGLMKSDTVADLMTAAAGTGLGASSGVLAVDLNELSAGAIASGDSLAFVDSDDSNNSKKETVDDLATLFAGTGLAASSAVLSVDLNELGAAAIASGDSFAFIDATDSNNSKKESVDDLATLFAGNGLSAASAVMAVDLNELSAAAVSVANDSIAIIDADDSNGSRKESIADLVSAMAGAGLTATNGVLSTDAGVATGVGDANATLAEGMNFGTTTFTADRTWTLPAAPASGDVVRVKAPGDLDGNVLIIAVNGGTSHSVDGQTSLILESSAGAVALMYVGSDKWIIF